MIGLLALPLSARAGWQLVWSDEFDGSSIDSSHWTFDIGTGPPYPGWGNDELEYYTSRPQNAYVSNGVLHIVAIQENYMGSSYTSAKLKSSGRFAKKYGRFEWRAKLPRGQGYWPALWMMPQDSVYGGWAASGEIDVVEVRGSNPFNVLGTLHFGDLWPNNDQSHGPSFTFTGGDSVTNFHTYALEWTNNAVRWYIDNQLYETQTSWWSAGGPYPAPFDQPFYLIMNLAVGGNFGGNPDGTAVFPGEMQVEYVRVYDWDYVPPPPPPAPVLKLRYRFDNTSTGTTAPSDTNGGAANVALQMLNGAGVAANYHGAANSGVGGAQTGSRALDFSANTAQPGTPGPLAAVTNSGLGFGVVSNFVVSFWMKQHTMMASGANIGPRVFVLGAGAPSDTGVADSIGLKFQTSSQLYFQIGGFTAMATFPADLPSNTWLFVAATYDGSSLKIYQGSDTNSATLISSSAVATTVNLGASAALYLGNRQNYQRSFDGWLDDFRFYAGNGDANFVENIRLAALAPPTISIQSSNSNLTLTWPMGQLQSATNLGGPWLDVTNAGSPFAIQPGTPPRFYRTRSQ